MTDKSWHTDGSISPISGRGSIPVVAGLLVVSAMLFLWVRISDLPTSTDNTPSSRKDIPDLTFVDLDGKPWKLSDHRGHVVLVNFWASWCPPCRNETPGLVRLSDDYQSRGLEVAGVAMDEGGLEGVRRFVREYGISYPVLIPGAGSHLMSSIETLPTTFLIDKQGRLAAVYSGAMEEAVFRRGVDRLLAEP